MTIEMLRRAASAKTAVSMLTADQKKAALRAMANALREEKQAILSANAQDIDKNRAAIGEVMLDRLRLNDARVEGMAKGIEDVAQLDDPVGRVLSCYRHPNGMTIQKVSVPIGVVAIIYESRPNVTSDAAALALMSGNVCVLRAGKEAHASAAAIVSALRKGLSRAGVVEDAVNLVEDTSRQSATELMTAVGLVDLLIPRGGGGLIKACVDNAKVPCIQTGMGICHVYVDRAADLDMALSILTNAKTSRPSVCNACEVCLVHRDVAARFLPMVRQALVEQRKAAGLVPVELRLSGRAMQYVEGTPAEAKDFDTEFLDYILAVEVVDDVQGAIAHIAEHSTHHSEAIVTEDQRTADLFLAAVDSTSVYHNVSTRFTDGGEFGLGCEMGISTQKLHARGPMGIGELTTYKYIIKGSGQVR